MSSRQAGEFAGVVALIAHSVLLLFTAATLEGSDRDLFGITFDARVVWVVAGVLGLCAVVWRPLVPAWAVVMTAACLGRSMTLLLDGSRIAAVPRTEELRGAAVWFVLWIAGALAGIVLEGSASLRRSLG